MSHIFMTFARAPARPMPTTTFTHTHTYTHKLTFCKQLTSTSAPNVSDWHAKARRELRILFYRYYCCCFSTIVGDFRRFDQIFQHFSLFVLSFDRSFAAIFCKFIIYVCMNVRLHKYVCMCVFSLVLAIFATILKWCSTPLAPSLAQHLLCCCCLLFALLLPCCCWRCRFEFVCNSCHAIKLDSLRQISFELIARTTTCNQMRKV